MRAVEADEPWPLLSPKDETPVRSISARALWVRILTARIETGEPYLIFSDHVNRARPEHHKLAGLEVKTSNLCSEITLPTGRDQHGMERTAVCCLCSLNLESWFEWQNHPTFIEDIMRFLDNVLQDFIDRAPPGMEKARYSAMRERSVGLGVMGFHSFLQSQNVPWESVIAKVWNKRMFKHIREQADLASHIWPRSGDRARMPRDTTSWSDSPARCRSRRPRRFPSSRGIPRRGSSRSRRMCSCRRRCRAASRTQPAFADAARGEADGYRRDMVIDHAAGGKRAASGFPDRAGEGSLQDCVRTGSGWIIEHAADRAPFICQSQSVNVFLPANVHKRDLHQIYFMAWKRGVKSLYYCRSLSISVPTM